MSSGGLLAHEIPDFRRALVRYAARNDWCTSGRHFVDDAYVEITVEGESKSARDRSRGHHQYIGLWGCRVLIEVDGRVAGHHPGRSVIRLFHQLEALEYSEAVLLIDNHHA